MFDDRELALLVWLGVLLGLGVITKTGRGHLGGILKLLFSPKIAGVFFVMAVYGGAVVWLLAAVGLRTTDLISETLFWFFVPGVVLLFRVATADRDSEDFFKKTLLEVVQFTVVVEFLVNLYPTHLAIEIALVPILVVLGGMWALAESRDEYRQVKGCVQFLLLLIVLAMLSNTVVSIIGSPNDFTTLDNLHEFLLPILLTTAFVPFLYVLGLYTAYEKAFVWVNFATEERRARLRAKSALISKLGGRTRDAHAVTMPWAREVASASSLRDSRRKVDEFRAWERERRLAPVRERERLQRYAGVGGVDEEGRRLDQREFKETRDALRTLAGAQMGWYRNRGKRYRADLAEILQSQFERSGLPPDHGITLRVSRDGQSWWAWRRTVTGWCFAAGANEPPPDEWLYDGPHPPKGSPGEGDPRWSRFGIDCDNW